MSSKAPLRSFVIFRLYHMVAALIMIRLGYNSHAPHPLQWQYYDSVNARLPRIPFDV